MNHYIRIDGCKFAGRYNNVNARRSAWVGGGGISISSNLAQHAEWLADYEAAGVAEVFCFNVGKNPREFIDAFAMDVLPQLTRRRGPTS